MPCYMPQAPISAGHVVIEPLEHVGSLAGATEEVADEVRNFQKCLVRLAEAQGAEAVFWEQHITGRANKHSFAIECATAARNVTPCMMQRCDTGSSCNVHAQVRAAAFARRRRRAWLLQEGAPPALLVALSAAGYRLKAPCDAIAPATRPSLHAPSYTTLHHPPPSRPTPLPSSGDPRCRRGVGAAPQALPHAGHGARRRAAGLLVRYAIEPRVRSVASMHLLPAVSRCNVVTATLPSASMWARGWRTSSRTRASGRWTLAAT